MHETVDQTIDRVADAMTAAAADPELTARVRERLATPGRSWVPAVAAASLGFGLVAGVILARWPAPATPHQVVEHVAAVPVAPLAPLAPAAVPSIPSIPSIPALVRPRAAVFAAANESSAPDLPIEIAALDVQPLDIPGVADIEPLEVAELRIAETSFDIEKEPR